MIARPGQRHAYDLRLVNETGQPASLLVTAGFVNRFAALPEKVHVSFDIDGLDPVLCPHTGTPVPGGLAFEEATYLLSRLAASGKRIIGFDLVEVSPGKEGDWDANVGARLLWHLCGVLAK